MGLASCAIVGPDGNEGVDELDKTYPDASDFEHVSFPALLEDVPAPADYNVVLYVTGHRICPEGFVCILPDAITVSESPYPRGQKQTTIDIIAPRQFQKGVRYLFSVHASDRELSDGDTFRRIRLIGYNRIP